jgi:hypothetical protein
MRRAVFSALLTSAATGLLVSGCPGSLDDPDRFKGPSAAECGNRVEEIFKTTCSTAGCHSGVEPAQGLDLESPGVASRLVGVAPKGVGCPGVLVDPKHPTESLLYGKLTPLPPCGVPMPFGKTRLTNQDIGCVRTWIESLAGDGGADAALDGSSPTPDARPRADAGTADVSLPPPADARPEASVTPEAAPSVGTGLKGQYFDNLDYTNLKLTRIDPTIDFVWSATESPDPAIATDGIYSVKWSGTVKPEFGETYTFYADSDDGVGLKVNGQQLIDDPTDHATMEFSGTITLEAGKSYAIELNWFTSQGIGEIHLYWSSNSRPRQVVPKERLFPAP